MSWGQPMEVPLQQSNWGENQAQSTWGENQQQSTWGEQPQQTNAPAWGDQQENKGDQPNKGGRGGGGGRGRGGRGRGEFRGGRGGRGRGRGTDENQKNPSDNNNQGESKPENSGGWGQVNQENKVPQQQDGWEADNAGKTTEGGWGQQSSWGNQAPQEQEEGEVKENRRGKKSDSPPPTKRPRPNPIVIVVEDDDCETQINFIVAENLKSKGLIKGEEVQICYEGNLKIEDCILNTRFISYDMDQKIKIQDFEEYSIENAKDELKAIGEDIFLGLVEGLDDENQKAINKLADNLLDKQQSIHFKEISLFSTKQLQKVESKSRLAFVRKLQI